MLREINNISILLVNWNNKYVILECLRSLRMAGYVENTVIVDNGSTDGSVGAIKKEYPEVLILEMHKNLGYSGGNNRGIEYLLKKGSKYIFILNPDTEVYPSTSPDATSGRYGVSDYTEKLPRPFRPGSLHRDTIEKLINVLEADKRVGIAGPKILSNEKKIWSCGGTIDPFRYSGGLIGINEEDIGQYDEMKEVDYIPGTAMMVRREVFERIGLFCEKYFIYYEDTELCMKAKKAGFKTLFVPQAKIWHKESSSFGKNSPAHQYYMTRNHLLFVERNGSWLVKLREFIRLPKTIYEHLKKQENFAILGIRDYFFRKFGRWRKF